VLDIQTIWLEKSNLENQRVTIRGEYRGWKDDVPHPRITRSDWVVRDHTGAIYVTGRGYPSSGSIVGKRVIVRGVVELSKDGIPFIRAERVSLEQ
jgi:hypothetical protein